jgi:hypothetical protein
MTYYGESLYAYLTYRELPVIGWQVILPTELPQYVFLSRAISIARTPLITFPDLCLFLPPDECLVWPAPN